MRQNENGNIILTLLMLMLMLSGSLALVYSSQMQQVISRSQTRIEITEIDNVRFSLARFLENPVALAQTIHSVLNSPTDNSFPSLLKCISDSTYVCPSGRHPLVLFAPVAGLWALNSKMTTGGNLFGFHSSLNAACTDVDCNQFFMTDQVCDTYPSGTTCPYRFVAFWSPLCPGSTACRQPQIELLIELEMSSIPGNSKTLINPLRFETKRIL